MRALIGFSLLLVVAACPPSQPTQAAKQSPSTSQSESGSLTGKWQGTASGLSVTLALQQSADSVSGSGTFTLASNANLGCGGETLQSTGNVTVTGKLTGRDFQGRMSFADTWNPPYIGSVISPDSLDGHFMSIDRGGCPLVLVRQH